MRGVVCRLVAGRRVVTGVGRHLGDADAVASPCLASPRGARRLLSLCCVPARLNFGEVWAGILVDFDRLGGCRVVFEWILLFSGVDHKMGSLGYHLGF